MPEKDSRDCTDVCFGSWYHLSKFSVAFCHKRNEVVALFGLQYGSQYVYTVIFQWVFGEAPFKLSLSFDLRKVLRSVRAVTYCCVDVIGCMGRVKFRSYGVLDAVFSRIATEEGIMAKMKKKMVYEAGKARCDAPCKEETLTSTPSLSTLKGVSVFLTNRKPARQSESMDYAVINSAYGSADAFLLFVMSVIIQASGMKGRKEAIGFFNGFQLRCFRQKRNLKNSLDVVRTGNLSPKRSFVLAFGVETRQRFTSLVLYSGAVDYIEFKF